MSFPYAIFVGTSPSFEIEKIKILKFPSARTSRTPISECANDSHIDFRVRERVAPQFQSAQTCRTPISECANESHLNLRVCKRVAHPFQSAQTIFLAKTKMFPALAINFFSHAPPAPPYNAEESGNSPGSAHLEGGGGGACN